MDLKTLYFLAKCSNAYYDFAVRISQHYGLPITADNSKFLDRLELVDPSTQKEQSIIANVSNSVCSTCGKLNNPYCSNHWHLCSENIL